MNTANLKSYAPQARKDFLAAVTTRALRLGISATSIAPVTVQGDIMLIGSSPYPRSMDAQRNQLIAKIKKSGFAHVMEEAAYTWFNRFMAIRYMEVHGYFSHGYRVLSNPSGGIQPEILQQAQNVAIPGLDYKRVVELLSQGNQQEELYRLLILSQIKALGQAMPFLFDTIDTSTEVLLPDGLLAPQSVVRKLVSEIPEDDWRSTEILGWLYQFYVSDEKARIDALVKKRQAVQPEDIPAKTQLFTPNWIVQFMTQNSLGRLWMDVYPDSRLKDKMPYYTAPAEQEPEVAAKLPEITPNSLDPSTLTAIDPAAGSGHILLVLYDLIYEFYRERGYPPREIPRLILSHNLYGLELDRRAAQIAGFAVLMRARRDDPTLLDNPPVVNVLSLVSSYGLDADTITDTLLAPIRGGGTFSSEDVLFPELAVQPRLAEAVEDLGSEATKADVKALIELFEEAEVYGSLIRVPDPLAAKLLALRNLVRANLGTADLERQATARDLSHLVRQAEFLAARYTVCVANPPYMGGSSMVRELRDFSKDQYPDTKSDLFAMFMERGFEFIDNNGINAMVTMQSWMFLSSYGEFRQKLLESKAIYALAHLGARAFRELPGEVVQTAVSIIRRSSIPKHRGLYFDATAGDDGVKSEKLRQGTPDYSGISQLEFTRIPSTPIIYAATAREVDLLCGTTLGDSGIAKRGLQPGDVPRMVRYWWEVSAAKIELSAVNRSEALNSEKRWFKFDSGGEFRRWFGNVNRVVDWENDGTRIKAGNNPIVPSEHLYFQPGIVWTKVGTGIPSFRFHEGGVINGDASPCYFPTLSLNSVLSYLNSSTCGRLLGLISPTMNLQVTDIERLPIVAIPEGAEVIAQAAVRLARDEWATIETSWEYTRSPAIDISSGSRAADSINHFEELVTDRNRQLAVLAERNDLLWSDALGLDPKHGLQIQSLSTYGVTSISSLVSYAIGCLMGRYSLDEPGLIYAHSSGEAFDPSRYRTFPADQDGIIPVTEDDFFGEEDTAKRFARWVETVWPNSPFDENLDFLARALGRKTNETAIEAIRRYLATDFYKKHLQTYKKRPIYWLFSSGKHRAFQALVYLHRYNETTLSIMRDRYVRVMFGKVEARISAVEAATQVGSTSERRAANKKLEKLRNQQSELAQFDQRLHHYALQRISLDLDDGVKVNYGKFSDPNVGDILANVKEVTGGKDD